MRLSFALIFLMLFTLQAAGQAKKRGQVKRKYRSVEAVSRQQAEVYIRGQVYDELYQPLAGAFVSIDGAAKGVNTNEDGEYLIHHLNTGTARVRVSYIGYKAHTADIVLRPGLNEKNVMLLMAPAHLEPQMANLLKREQQSHDIPTAITSVRGQKIEQQHISNLTQLSEYVPGLMVMEQGATYTNFVIRGIGNGLDGPGAEPRVAALYNDVPLNASFGGSMELFDLDRVEVARGPQHATMGRSAVTGAVHYASVRPTKDFEGYLTAGYGNFGNREVRGAVNVPIIENKLMLRGAGIYSAHDELIPNSAGASLLGKNTVGGRFSARYKPMWRHRIDLSLNYQKDDTPGVPFVNTDYFSGPDAGDRSVALNTDFDPGTGKEFFDISLDYRYYMDEHTYWTSLTSYRTSDGFARWDGDGTLSPALALGSVSSSSQFYQEVRGNFAANSRMVGSIGGSFRTQNTSITNSLAANETYLVSQVLGGSLLDAAGVPISSPVIPADSVNGPLDPIVLPAFYNEDQFLHTKKVSLQAFFDMTYQLSRKIFVSGGIRFVYDTYKLSSEVPIPPSATGIGSLNGFNYLYYSPKDFAEQKGNLLSYTFRAGLKYRLNEYGNFFANYSFGRRPNELYFDRVGNERELEAETLHCIEAGIKADFLDRIYIDVTGFMQRYNNFVTPAGKGDTLGVVTYSLQNGGKAKVYGMEASLQVAIIKQLSLFANYSWLHTALDSLNSKESTQEYRGRVFAYAPEQSLQVGLNAQIKLGESIEIFARPSYAWKSDFYFDAANSPALLQTAHGVLNANAGIRLVNPRITLSVWGTNLLDETFLAGKGSSSYLFGFTTVVPGPPRMFGSKLTWQFREKEKRRFRRF